MQLHTVRPTHRFKTSKRIGRGGKRGTYSGRGMKGQKSRAGSSMRPAIRDFIKSMPKLRGEEFSKLPKKSRVVTIHLSDLKRVFPDGSTVTHKALVRAGLISRTVMPKVLNGGEPPTKLLVRGVFVSKSAREKIKKTGGKVEEISKS